MFIRIFGDTTKVSILQGSLRNYFKEIFFIIYLECAQEIIRFHFPWRLPSWAVLHEAKPIASN